jgi:hypothetical protein
LAAPVARWVRLVVGMAAEEYQLTNAELDQRPRSELLSEGIVALAWLRTIV